MIILLVHLHNYVINVLLYIIMMLYFVYNEYILLMRKDY